MLHLPRPALMELLSESFPESKTSMVSNIRKLFFICVPILLIICIILCIGTIQRSETIDNPSVDYNPPSASEQDWVTWLANHWDADSTTWIELANLNNNGDIEDWLSTSDLYGYSAKVWNNIDAARSINPIIIPTDCDNLNNTAIREYLAKTFSVQLMDELCKNVPSWSFQITEYKISKIVTEKASRNDSEQEIWICFFLADFKFDGIISPIAHGNTNEFVGAESFGMYEMSLADGNCIFYPVYSDTYQRVSQ